MNIKDEIDSIRSGKVIIYTTERYGRYEKSIKHLSLTVFNETKTCLFFADINSNKNTMTYVAEYLHNKSFKQKIRDQERPVFKNRNNI